MKQTTLIFLFIISLVCTSAFAQNQTQPIFPNTTPSGTTSGTTLNTGMQQAQMNPIVGVWQTTIALGQGLPEATGIVYIFPNNTYREEMYVNKQLGAFWEGNYTLTPDGTFTQMEGKKSPQICISKSQCIANEGESKIVSRVSLKSPNEIVLNLQDATSGQLITVTYTRMQNPAVGTAGDTTGGNTGLPNPNFPTLPNPNMPVVTNPNTPNPIGLAGNTPSGTTVAANAFNDWIGSYSDGELTVHIGSPQGNYMQKGETFFQLSVQGNAQRLEGKFITQNGDSFPIVLERQNGLVAVTSNTLSFSLTPMAPTQQAGPTNPLGN